MNQISGKQQSPSAEPFMGDWRITEMEMWDQKTFDLLGPAFFRFKEGGMGEFSFIAVKGFMDCRFSKEGGKPRVEFSWEGFDEKDPASGRGWALVEGTTLQGRIFIHAGDDSAFTAVATPRRA